MYCHRYIHHHSDHGQGAVYVQQCVWGPLPQNFTCLNCNHCGVTLVRYEAGLLTWLIVGLLVLIGCWLGCCLIPFCVDGCKDVHHHCPNCQMQVGAYRHI